METNETYDPAEALRDVQSARERVAARAQAPRFYYPMLGAAVAVAIAGQAVGGYLGAMGGFVCAMVSVLLISRYRQATGLWVTYGGSGPRTRLVGAAYAVVLFGLLAAGVWVQFTGRPGWLGIPLGLAGLLLTVVVGRLMEPRLREEIRTGAAIPTGLR